MADAITPLPTPAPSRARPATFSVDMDAFLSAILGFTTESNSLAIEIEEATVTVAAAVVTTGEDVLTCQASAAVAVTATGAVKWVSGTAYTEGDGVWSPQSFQTYRRKITGGGTIDPSLDQANWQSLTGSGANYATSLKY